MSSLASVRRGGENRLTGNPRRSGVLAVVCLVWLVLLINVQPWSSSESGSVAILKGATLMGVGLALLLVLPARPVFTIPWPVLPWALYASYLICSALLQDGGAEPLTRALRVALGLLIPVVVLVFIRKDQGVLETAAFIGFSVLALIIVAGVFLNPGGAWWQGRDFSSGARLRGAILPMMPPRVAEIGAILCGFALLLWTGKRIRLPLAVAAAVAGLSLIILSRTRTAALALLIGLLLAFFFTRRRQVGKRGLSLLAAGAVPVLLAWPIISEWLTRGQSPELMSKLSGRTAVWDFVINSEPDTRTFLFGHGLGEKRILLRRGEGDFQAVPIDNSWIDAYWETGIIGLCLVAGAMAAAFVFAFQTQGPVAKAFSLFLLGYVSVASVNESGLCDLSSLTLLVLLAVTISAADRLYRSGPRSHADAFRGRISDVPKQRRAAIPRDPASVIQEGPL